MSTNIQIVDSRPSRSIKDIDIIPSIAVSLSTGNHHFAIAGSSVGGSCSQLRNGCLNFPLTGRKIVAICRSD
jgi:hypothetical protein